jgi:hypothetical protein
MTKINSWVARLVVAALSSVEAFFISKIKSTVVREGLRKLLRPIQDSALAFADDNPRNDEQLEAIWKGFAHIELPDYAEGQIEGAIAKIGDENVRTVLSTLSHPIVNMLRLVTDEDPNNEVQLKIMLKAFVSDPQNQKVLIENVIVPLIEAKVKDESLRAWLIDLIRNGLFADGQV